MAHARRSGRLYEALDRDPHPSGETIAFVVERDPMSIEESLLYAAVRDTVIAAILGRHWPGHGGIHTMIGPLAGCRPVSRVGK